MVIMKAKELKKSKAKLSTVEVEPEQHAEDGDPQITKEIRIIAQEVKIVRSLACNDVNKRNRQLRKLRKWFQLRTRSSFPFSEEDFLRIWKGLYYNMWMSDKPLVQEELAEELGQLLECFDGDVATSVKFFGAFMQIMCNEWFGIDQWRIDKFMMLTRRMLRYMFRVLKNAGWTTASIQLFNEHMTLTVLAPDSPALGLTMHFLDIFFEELAKVSEGKISADQVGHFVRPFVNFLGTVHDVKLVSHCRKQVLYHLLYQSALGREYTDKYEAWKRMGFPTDSIDDLVLEEVAPAEGEEDGDEEITEETTAEEGHLDPRAGNVDVVMPELPFDGKYVIEELEKQIYKNNECCTKRRKVLRKLLELIQRYQNGEFPLGIKRMPHFKSQSTKPLMKDKIEQLESLENEMYGVGRKLKQLNKRKRRKLLKSLNLENVDESNFDQTVMKAIPKQYLKERKRKAQSAMMSGWVEEEIDKEAIPPQKKAKNKLGEDKAVAVAKLELGAESKELDAKSNDIAPKKPIKQIKKHETLQPEIKEKKQNKEAVDQQTAEKKAKKVAQLAEKNDKTEKTAADIPKKPKPTPINEGENPKTKSIADVVPTTPTTATKSTSEWDTPLSVGEIEYFIPSRKTQLRKANANLVPNPLAKKAAMNPIKLSTSISITPKTPSSEKRVKIALKHNTIQNPSEYIRQIKSSPNLPFDATKKPGKGLLKPHSMPSPINPFYKKKIGLRLLNDTL